MRYFIHLGYRGTSFSGWQRQKSTSNTIQQSIEDAISKMLHQNIRIMGCGRTDAGVHALNYFAHFDYDKAFDFDPIFRLNKMLPEDIAIQEFIPVGPYAHAQKDAVKRKYSYYIHTKKDPFINDQSTLKYLEENHLDFDKMQKAVSLIAMQTDFRSMCKSPNQYKSTNCIIFDCGISHDSETGKYHFSITANRFLQAMIRLLIGRILDIGRGSFNLVDFEFCLATGTPPKFPIPAPPQGLYLENIEYPYLNISTNSLS